jgi:hypothetical protein
MVCVLCFAVKIFYGDLGNPVVFPVVAGWLQMMETPDFYSGDLGLYVRARNFGS